MSERDEPGQPPSGPSKVTTYTSGKVPGVHYVDGVAHSPPGAEPSAAPGQAAGGAPGAAGAWGAAGAGAPGAARAGADAQRSRGYPGDQSDRPAEAPPRKPPRVSRPRRRARPLRWIAAFLIILLVALLILAWLVWSRIDKVDAVPDDHGSAVSDGQVYALVGSDSREELSDEERSELGTGSASGQRTDTIMLLYIPNSGRSALISIPRDSVVDIPGQGSGRINASYAFGGPRLLVETIEQNTGVAVDDYVEIGFAGFASIVNALGGVEMCLDDPIADERAHIDLPAGCQVLDGPDALGYARARYSDPRGDLGRVERQRDVLGAIADETLSAGTLLNPLRLTRVGLSGGDALTIDEGTNPYDLARFAWTLGGVASGGGDTLTVPLGEVGNTVTWHPEDAPRLWAALQDGDPVPSDLLGDD